MKRLLIVERIVLESISSGARTVEAIARDTDLDEGLVKNILFHFHQMNMVQYVKGIYTINEKGRNWAQDINHKDSIRDEVKDVFSNAVHDYFSKTEKNSKIKMQKVWLTEKEEKILQAQLYSLETFIQGIQKEKSRVKDFKTSEKKLIFWGFGQYADVVKSSIKVAS
jgi:Mn-dependent DtxR family transcriptional regulator